MDDVTNALTEELSASETELEAIDRQMEPLRLRRQELEAVAHALRYTIERRSARQASEPSDRSWLKLSLRGAVERILVEQGPLAVADIRAGLRNQGRLNDARKSISATLSHLKAEGKASSAEGLWRLHSTNGQSALPPAFDQFRAREPAGRPG